MAALLPAEKQRYGATITGLDPAAKVVTLKVRCFLLFPRCMALLCAVCCVLCVVLLCAVCCVAVFCVLCVAV